MIGGTLPVGHCLDGGLLHVRHSLVEYCSLDNDWWNIACWALLGGLLHVRHLDIAWWIS